MISLVAVFAAAFVAVNVLLYRLVRAAGAARLRASPTN